MAVTNSFSLLLFTGYLKLLLKAAFLKLLCGLSTPGDFGEIRVLILQVWEGGGADGAGLLSIL